MPCTTKFKKCSIMFYFNYQITSHVHWRYLVEYKLRYFPKHAEIQHEVATNSQWFTRILMLEFCLHLNFYQGQQKLLIFWWKKMISPAPFLRKLALMGIIAQCHKICFGPNLKLNILFTFYFQKFKCIHVLQL